MDKYNFRGLLFKHKRLMNFGKTGEKVDKKSDRKFSIFGEGPIIYLENNKIDSMFNILYKMKLDNPTRNDFQKLVVDLGIPEVEGIYLIDMGGRKSIITTKNMANSMAKVLRDSLNAQTSSDLFSIRLAKSQVMKFSILSFKKSYAVAATYSGLHDTLNPNIAISDRTANFRGYNGYRVGLEMSGHYSTLAIETLLDKGIVPEFMTEKEVSIWRNKEFETKSKISATDFVKYKFKLISDDSE